MVVRDMHCSNVPARHSIRRTLVISGASVGLHGGTYIDTAMTARGRTIDVCRGAIRRPVQAGRSRMTSVPAGWRIVGMTALMAGWAMLGVGSCAGS